jgi:predicted phage terminase large subunit-like protein
MTAADLFGGLRRPSPAEMLVALDRADVADDGLRTFVRLAWSQVEPNPLVWGWHLDAVCEHLEAVTRRDVRDLVINLPPGFSKSLVTSVLWPAWVWSRDPAHRWIVASYSDEVVLRDARKARTLVQGDWYSARWPRVRIPSDASASKAVGAYYTTAGGMRYSTTTRGSVTGQHCHTALVDDPLDPLGAASSTELDACLEWWTGTMPTRFLDHRTSARVLIMQRLHERDLTREFVRAGATVLCLPMRYDPAHPHRYPRDRRTAAGELLCRDRVPEDAAARMERTLGPSRAAAQLQQRPVPAGGGVFRAEWFKRWTELPAGGTWSMEVDATFKKTDDGSYVVIQVWCDDGPRHYLVDQHRERMGFAATCSAIRAMRARWPKVRTTRIEDKANGPAIIEALSGADGIGGVVAVPADGGKEARANAVQGTVAGGDVYLPDEHHAKYPDGRVGAAWVPAFVHECTSFPKGENDDQVDGMTQHLNAVSGSYAARLKSAMGKQ